MKKKRRPLFATIPKDFSAVEELQTATGAAGSATGEATVPPHSNESLIPPEAEAMEPTEIPAGAEVGSDRRNAPAPTARKDARWRRNGNADQLPPHSLEAEMGVLACIMLSPTECLDALGEKNFTPEYFYDLRHRTIYEIASEMHARSEAIDVITLQQHLKDKQLLDGVGGLAFLSSLPDAAPSAANLCYYAEIVQEKYTARRILTFCAETTKSVYENGDEPEKVLEQLETEALKLRQKDGTQTKRAREVIMGLSDQLDHYLGGKKQIDGLSTGFANVDKVLWGLKPEMIVFAGRTSTGKTAFATNITEHLAVDCKEPVGIISLEMDAESLMFRMLCTRAQVDSMRIKRGEADAEESARIFAAHKELAMAPIYIHDEPAMTSAKVNAIARRMLAERKIRVLIIDYLQLIVNPTSRRENRQQEVSQVSNGIKQLARTLKIPVVCLCQMNRDIDKHERMPRLSDLRDSGSIEQDADVVGILYRPPKEKKESDSEHGEQEKDEPQGYPVNLWIGKHRNGPTGTVRLRFIKEQTRFYSRNKMDE